MANLLETPRIYKSPARALAAADRSGRAVRVRFTADTARQVYLVRPGCRRLIPVSCVPN